MKLVFFLFFTRSFVLAETESVGEVAAQCHSTMGRLWDRQWAINDAAFESAHHVQRRINNTCVKSRISEQGCMLIKASLGFWQLWREIGQTASDLVRQTTKALTIVVLCQRPRNVSSISSSR